MLSDDNVFIEGRRQRPLTKKKIESWVNEMVMTFTEEEQKNYDRNQKLIDLLNMNAGDQNYVVQNGLINSNRWYNSYPVEDILQNELQGSKKSNPKHNYHGFLTNFIGTYVLHKSGDNFQTLLNKCHYLLFQFLNLIY